jgi:hypothetical protein
LRYACVGSRTCSARRPIPAALRSGSPRRHRRPYDCSRPASPLDRPTALDPTGHPTGEIDSREAVLGGCSRGRVTSAASRRMNSSGLITRCEVPSRHGDLSLSTTCPAALVCARSLASAGRVMQRHSCSSPWRSSAPQHTAACRLKPCMPTRSVCLKSASLSITPCTVSTFCPARGLKAIRYVQATACSGLSARASSESPSVSAT